MISREYIVSELTKRNNMKPCNVCGAIYCLTTLRCDTTRLISGSEKCDICSRIPCQTEEACNKKSLDDYNQDDYQQDITDDLIAEAREADNEL